MIFLTLVLVLLIAIEVIVIAKITLTSIKDFNEFKQQGDNNGSATNAQDIQSCPTEHKGSCCR